MDELRATVEEDVDQLRRAIDQLSSTVDQLKSSIEAELAQSRAEVAELPPRLERIEEGQRAPRAGAEILFRSNWSELAPLVVEPLISVVLPTRNRSRLLQRVIESVLAQRYSNWELLVVDDGSHDDTVDVVQKLADERVRLLDGGGSGAGHARNVALREATGSLVTFVDDDNVMAPGWLRAVAVAFQDQPGLHAVYGAQLRSSEHRLGESPFLLYVSPFDWERLIRDNYIDLGVVAHRNMRGSLAFDETLPRLIDWDYIVRLVGQFGIDPLPVVASLYTTDAAERISSRRSPVFESLAERLRQRFREAFPTVTDAEVDAPPPRRPETRGSDKAWMTAADADLLEVILQRLASRVSRRLQVLEWGSGLSTVHYPRHLADLGVEVWWLSIEYDRDFFRDLLEPQLRERNAAIVLYEDLGGAPWRSDGAGVTAVVFDEGPINPFDANPMRYADRAKDLDHYVGLPASLGLHYDAILVDGRKRRRCLLEAATLLEDGGVALLHDAQRPYYHSAFAAFRSGRRIGDELWIGSQSDSDFTCLVPEAALAAPGLEYVPGT